MNGSLIIVGVVAAVSIFFVGMMAYRIGSVMDITDFPFGSLPDKSTLDEDLRDILELIPLEDIRRIIDNYVMYDEQIHETVNFINEQKKFIVEEFRKMPEFNRLLEFLRLKGFTADHWSENVQGFWKSLPQFVKSEPTLTLGGFTMMIGDIMKILPREELHELLKQKRQYSSSFRWFLQLLGSEFFREFCCAIENNVTLQRHVHWAKESGIEVTFAMEFFNHLYMYFLEELL